jgi:hypothetical protein
MKRRSFLSRDGRRGSPRPDRAVVRDSTAVAAISPGAGGGSSAGVFPLLAAQRRVPHSRSGELRLVEVAGRFDVNPPRDDT